MQNVTVIQGRKIKPTDIQLIQQLLAENPSWGRSRLSLELCQQWNWRRPDQSPKDMACRSLLLKLGRAGQIAPGRACLFWAVMGDLTDYLVKIAKKSLTQ